MKLASVKCGFKMFRIDGSFSPSKVFVLKSSHGALATFVDWLSWSTHCTQTSPSGQWLTYIEHVQHPQWEHKKLNNSLSLTYFWICLSDQHQRGYVGQPKLLPSLLQLQQNFLSHKLISRYLSLPVIIFRLPSSLHVATK